MPTQQQIQPLHQQQQQQQQQAQSSSLNAAAAAAAAAVFSNRSFIDDDSNPPSYHSIYPTGGGLVTILGAEAEMKENEQKPSTSASSPSNPTTTSGSSGMATIGMSNLVANLFQNNENITSQQQQQQQQQPQEPIISYDQLYGHVASPPPFLPPPPPPPPPSTYCLPSTLIIQPNRQYNHRNSNHHYHHHRPLSHHLPPPSLSPLSHPHEENINYRVRKQFNQIFTKAYLLKHFIFISASSMMIILFQIILINNQSVLSHLAAGLWCGLANLFTLLITIITLRYAKVWLLIISIILHFMCLTVSLGSFVVINSVAASRYSACTTTLQSSPSYNPFYDHIIYEQQQQPHLVVVDKTAAASTLSLSAASVNNCLGTNLKYANIAMIVLGATCMVMFVSFFIKLVAAFNNVHSTRESC